MTTYRMKLSDFQMRALIGILVWYWNGLIAEGKNTDDVDKVHLLVMSCCDAN